MIWKKLFFVAALMVMFEFFVIAWLCGMLEKNEAYFEIQQKKIELLENGGSGRIGEELRYENK